MLSKIGYDISQIEKNNKKNCRTRCSAIILSGKNYIFHRFIILPELNVKETLLKAFKSERILAKSVYQANTLDCVRAKDFAEKAIELPCHQFIDRDELNFRIEKIL